MKHLNKKQSIRGAGGKKSPKPQPAILNPPKLGGFKSVSSFSVAEIVDLISDGPIEGLVDQNGRVLSDSIFKGVYLDNTPIQNTESLSDQTSYGSVSIAESLNAVARVWMESNGSFKTINGLQNLLFSAFKNIGLGYAEFLGYPRPFLSYTPLYFKLFDDTIEIHRYSPIENKSPILASFEGYIKDLSNRGDSVSKAIADENLKNLDKVKTLMKESVYGLSNPRGTTAASFIIIDLGEKQIDGIRDKSVDEKIGFFVSGIPNEGASVFAQPEVSNNKFTGAVKSLLILYVPLRELEKKLNGVPFFCEYYIQPSLLTALNNSDIQLEASEKFNISNNSSALFNFSNVSCQFKNGEEYQASLNNFDKVFNDYLYESKLYGPFDKTKPIQRIKLDNQFNDGIKNMSLSVVQSALSSGLEGSVDARPKGNYSDWNDENEKRDYESLSVTHTIENPFVDQVSVSIVVNALSDTVEEDKTLSDPVGKLQAGAKVPSIVAIRIETGKITNGQRSETAFYSYSIVGLIEGQCIIDFGTGESGSEELLKDSVKIIEGDGDNLIDAPLTQPFKLSPLVGDEEPLKLLNYLPKQTLF
jgi:small nuclear ribonucleoprotein (snRNP)-like protein